MRGNIIFVLFFVALSCLASPEEAKKKECAGVDCIPPPAGTTCKNDPKAKVKTGMAACCPDLECTHKDGSVIKHAGFSGAGSSGSSYSYGDPSSGSSGSGYSKNFASYSSFSTGGNVNDIKKLGNNMMMPKMLPPPKM